jgi:hypothetical protein
MSKLRKCTLQLCALHCMLIVLINGVKMIFLFWPPIFKFLLSWVYLFFFFLKSPYDWSVECISLHAHSWWVYSSYSASDRRCLLFFFCVVLLRRLISLFSPMISVALYSSVWGVEDQALVYGPPTGLNPRIHRIIFGPVGLIPLF